VRLEPGGDGVEGEEDGLPGPNPQR
jgi:hypothetical protein